MRIQNVKWTTIFHNVEQGHLSFLTNKTNNITGITIET
jgi:hypothetical protein